MTLTIKSETIGDTLFTIEQDPHTGVYTVYSAQRHSGDLFGYPQSPCTYTDLTKAKRRFSLIKKRGW